MFRGFSEPFDVIFCIDDVEYPAHRKVLVEAAPYFRIMLTSHFIEKDSEKIVLSTIDPVNFSDLLDFIYTRNCVCNGDVVDLLMMSDYMGLPNLYAHISLNLDFIIDENNCLDLLHYSFYTGLHELSVKVIASIVQNNILIQCSNSEKDWNFRTLHMLFPALHLRYYYKLQLVKYLRNWMTVNPIDRTQLVRSVVETVLNEGIRKSSVLDFINDLRKLLTTRRVPNIIDFKPNLDLYIIGGHEAKFPLADHFACHNEHLMLQAPRCNYFNRNTIPCLQKQRMNFASATSPNGFYLIGGKGRSGSAMVSMEHYDYDDRIWSTLPNLKEGRMLCAAVSWKGMIFLTGGLNAAGETLSDLQMYFPTKKLWKRINNMKSKRQGHCMVCVEGVIYSLGGHDGETALSSVEFYNQFENEWSMATPMNTARHRFGAAVFKQFIFVFCGMNNDGQSLNTVERYNSVTNMWEVVCIMYPCYDLAVASLGTEIYICGGYNGICSLNTIVCFDTISSVTRLVSNLRIARHGLAAFMLPNNKSIEL